MYWWNELALFKWAVFGVWSLLSSLRERKKKWEKGSRKNKKEKTEQENKGLERDKKIKRKK